MAYVRCFQIQGRLLNAFGNYLKTHDFESKYQESTIGQFWRQRRETEVKPWKSGGIWSRDTNPLVTWHEPGQVVTGTINRGKGCALNNKRPFTRQWVIKILRGFSLNNSWIMFIMKFSSASERTWPACERTQTRPLLKRPNQRQILKTQNSALLYTPCNVSSRCLRHFKVTMSSEKVLLLETADKKCLC